MVGKRGVRSIIPIPVIFSREGAWFIATCPVFDLVTQGKTQKEAEDMMADMLKEYVQDKDVPKPPIRVMTSYVSVSFMPIKLPGEIPHGKSKAIIKA